MSMTANFRISDFYNILTAEPNIEMFRSVIETLIGADNFVAVSNTIVPLIINSTISGAIWHRK